MAIALVATPSQAELVAHLDARLPIAGLFTPGRRPAGPQAPLFTDLTAMLQQSGALTCCFLAPYVALEKDVRTCLEAGIDVLCAGPLPCSQKAIDQLLATTGRNGARLAWGGAYRFSPLFQALRQQRSLPSFGSPVYLRQVAGGGHGLLLAWWALCELLSQALELLDARLEAVHLSACRHRGKYHAALTGRTASRAMAQLLVAPFHPGDLALLGTGGLLGTNGLAGSAATATAAGTLLHSSPELRPEAAWLSAFAQKKDSPVLPERSTHPLHRAILSGLRRALRQGQPVRVEVP
jgi:predicted dehydrogenase